MVKRFFLKIQQWFRSDALDNININGRVYYGSPKTIEKIRAKMEALKSEAPLWHPDADWAIRQVDRLAEWMLEGPHFPVK